MSRTIPRPQTLRAEFHSDQNTADRLREALQTTADALICPTRENTGRLLELAIDAMMTQARSEPGASPGAPPKETP